MNRQVSVTSTRPTVSPSRNYNDTQDIHYSLLDGIYCYLGYCLSTRFEVSTTVQHFHIFMGVNIDHFTDLLGFALLFFFVQFCDTAYHFIHLRMQLK